MLHGGPLLLQGVRGRAQGRGKERGLKWTVEDQNAGKGLRARVVVEDLVIGRKEGQLGVKGDRLGRWMQLGKEGEEDLGLVEGEGDLWEVGHKTL